MYDTILVSIDGSEPANRAAEHALDIASRFDSDLHALYVVDTRRYGSSAVAESDAILEDLTDQGQDLLEDLDIRADVDVTTEVRRGRPSAEIDADLVVLGNRGLGGAGGGQIGSVAERVVRYANRPVITA